MCHTWIRFKIIELLDNHASIQWTLLWLGGGGGGGGGELIIILKACPLRKTRVYNVTYQTEVRMACWIQRCHHTDNVGGHSSREIEFNAWENKLHVHYQPTHGDTNAYGLERIKRKLMSKVKLNFCSTTNVPNVVITHTFLTCILRNVKSPLSTIHTYIHVLYTYTLLVYTY